MRKIVLFMHVSVDGFVAGLNGEMDWIHVDEALFDYAASETDKSDTALYGRVTYQMMEGYWPTAADKPNATKHDRHHSAWYNKVLKVVLSKTMRGVKKSGLRVISEHVTSEISALKNSPGENIIIFGSPSLVHLLMADHLIDEYWLFINPVLLGEGIPLFKNVPGRLNLKLIQSETISSRVVCLHYKSQANS